MAMNTTLDIFKSSMHLSAFWTYLSCYAEFIGGLLIMIGLFTRIAAFVLFINMLVATLFVGFKNFFLGGAAYPCLLMVIFFVIILSGPMAYSIDAVLAKKKKTEKFNSGFRIAFKTLNNGRTINYRIQGNHAGFVDNTLAV
jgi:uncharacterized membrane protein YphA (DoxX/SURF4 family)